MVNAEGLFTALIAKHNLPLAVSDHFTKVVRKMFPDSQIAKQYGSGRTKTTAILRGKKHSLPHCYLNNSNIDADNVF